jgi:hypothetical protein
MKIQSNRSSFARRSEYKCVGQLVKRTAATFCVKTQLILDPQKQRTSDCLRCRRFENCNEFAETR